MTAWGTRARAAALGSLVAVVLAGCGGDGRDARATEAAPPDVASTAPATTHPPTTTERLSRPTTTTTAPTTSTTALATTTTTSSTSTTTLPPTTLPALPQPIAPPPEDGSTEPRMELGTIEIPRLGLQRTLQEGIRLSTLDRGPGHWPGTAMPGDVGTVVVAGHRVSHNADFRHVDQLQAGDEVIFTTGAGRFVYLVTEIRIVGPDALWIVDQTYDRTATLFACHPPGSTRERIVVHLRAAT